MAVVEFSIKDVEKRITLKRFEELVTELGLESERKEESIHVDVTADRPELMDFSELMLAVLMLNGDAKPSEDAYALNREPVMEIEVSDSVKGIRPYIAAVVVRNIDLRGNNLRYLINFSEKIGDTYGRKRSKLAIGMHNLDVIKKEIVYEIVEYGKFVPLGYDFEMDLDEVMIKSQTGMEYKNTIKKGFYPILRDSEKILSLIPILNSEATKVSGSTGSMLVDITGTNRSIVEKVAEIFNCIFRDMGGDVNSVAIIYGRDREVYPKAEWKEIRTDANYINSIIGSSLSNERIMELAGMMGYVTSLREDKIGFMVAPYRTDIFGRRDIVEDIAISYGYNNIENIPIVSSAVGSSHPDNEVYDKISLFFVGCGFTEAMNRYLTNGYKQFEIMNKPNDDNVVKIDYSKTNTFTMLRKEILPMLLQNVSESMNDSMPQKIFEYGKVFGMKNGKVYERDSVAFVSVHSKINFSEAKSVVLSLSKYMKLDFVIKEHDDAAFIEGRCAAVTFRDGRYIGMFGEIHPKVLDSFRIGEPVVAGEMLIG